MLSAYLMRRSEVLIGFLLYCLEATAGFPVLAGWIADSTWYFSGRVGFFLGFPIAVWFTSQWKFKAKNFWQKCYVFFIAHLIILSTGVLGITFKAGLLQALNNGFFPILIPAIIKTILLASISQMHSNYLLKAIIPSEIEEALTLKTLNSKGISPSTKAMSK